MLDFRLAHHRDISDMIGEFLLPRPFHKKGWFLWLTEVCTILWDLWRERKNRAFSPYILKIVINDRSSFCNFI